jgi:hypothetical protein
LIELAARSIASRRIRFAIIDTIGFLHFVRILILLSTHQANDAFAQRTIVLMIVRG